MWEYVKGSEEDFDGAPEWAVYLAEVHTRGKDVRAWEASDNKKYSYVSGCHESKIGKVFYDEFIKWKWSSKPIIIAERRKVDKLQSRVNDANLTEALIAERGTRYGEFKDGAAIMQQLKDVMHSAPKWDALKPSQKEALEMIQHKIGRILNGDPDYDDNWKDIAGYATLIVKEIKG